MRRDFGAPNSSEIPAESEKPGHEGTMAGVTRAVLRENVAMTLEWWPGMVACTLSEIQRIECAPNQATLG